MQADNGGHATCLRSSSSVIIKLAPSLSPELAHTNNDHQLQLSSIVRDVNYSCGSCGYELNLNFSNRKTCSLIDLKSIKRGIISFFSVDESRFTQIQQLHWPSWIPFFNSKRQRIKLLCRSCGNHLGYAYTSPSQSGISDDSRIYDIKLTALLPSFCEEPSQRLEDMGKFESASLPLWCSNSERGDRKIFVSFLFV